MAISLRKHRGSPETAIAKATEDRSLIPPCQAACPLKTNIREYVDLVAQGKIMEALQVIRKDNPFPSICAYVCTSPCEEACRRGEIDKPIAIRALKRFAVEFGGDRMIQGEPGAKTRPEKVAVVGSGPAGLSAAYYLRQEGYPVTIFEAHKQVGGMLRVGIPQYRLPREVLDIEVQRLIQMGVEIKTGTRVVSLDLLFDLGYQAIFITIGAHQSLRLGIEGEENPGVIDGATFLREINLGFRPSLGKQVAVIGGGNVAIDAARTALRLGAEKVTVLYRRTRAEMPAEPEQIETALQENIEFHFLVTPAHLLRKNGQLITTCLKMALGESDASGRRKPVPIAGSEFKMVYDNIITAIGQAPDTPSSFRISTGRGSTIQVDPATLTTNREGVFAGGDAVTGPATVVEALAAGRKAAQRLDDYLQKRYPLEKKEPREYLKGALKKQTIEKIRKEERQNPPFLPFDRKDKDFQLLEQTYSWEKAIQEARRCLWCGMGAEVIFTDKCPTCLNCLRICPYGVPRLNEKGEIEIAAEQCLACGLCVAECPAKAIFLRKPFDGRHISRELAYIARTTSQSRPRPLIIGFCCQYGLFGSGALAGFWRKPQDNFGIIPVFCVAKVEKDHLLEAFQLGAEGVFIAGCGEGCSRENSIFWVQQRVKTVKKALVQMGLEPERLELFVNDEQELDLEEKMNKFVERIGRLHLTSVIEKEVGN